MESNDYKKHLLFNRKFKKYHKSELFQNGGYGELMEKSSLYNNKYMDNFYKLIISKFKFHRNASLLIYYYLIGIKNIFITDLTIYNKIDNYGQYQTLDNKKIKDYSSSIKNIGMSDYKIAYSININNDLHDNIIKKRSIEDIINERNKLDEYLKKH